MCQLLLLIACIAASAMSRLTQECHVKGNTDPSCLNFAVRYAEVIVRVAS